MKTRIYYIQETKGMETMMNLLWLAFVIAILAVMNHEEKKEERFDLIWVEA